MLQIQWFTDSMLTQVVLLLFAYLLSAVIGMERQRRLKSAGMRTHTLVGLGSALFTLVSAYGFSTVIGPAVVVDPSRIAAQIVSGIGFLGAGVIFVRQNAVTGLTTAASIWVAAAIGMACGAGMPVLALLATALHLFAVRVLSLMGRWAKVDDNDKAFILQYRDGHGALRSVLAAAAEMGLEPVVTNIHRIERQGKTLRIQALLRFRNLVLPTSQVIEKFSASQGVVSVVLMDPVNE